MIGASNVVGGVATSVLMNFDLSVKIQSETVKAAFKSFFHDSK